MKVKSIIPNLQSILPQNHPTADSLFHLDFSFGSVKYERSFVVDKTNLESTKKDFKTDNVQVGDEVRPWDDGGWESLTGRAGEEVVRNGEIVAKRLTRLS